jgi:import inner membrane translocase subunit TIM10
MSFLGRGGNVPNGGINADKIDMAITEYVLSFACCHSFSMLHRLDTVTDFFNRMVSLVILGIADVTLNSVLHRSCHTKCISQRYAEADLNKGESVCIDRCVAKFSEVQKKVGEKLQSKGAANAASSGSTFGSL